jgi:RNA polymerase sigma-70 factor (ECF subfamily)
MTTFVEWTDVANLVLRAQRGDGEAYGRLSEQFRPTVYAMALSRLRDPNEAQELTQDVLVHAYVKLGQLRHPAAFAGWLRQITARMAVNRVLRRGTAGLGGDSVVPGLDAAAARTPSPVDNLIHREEAEQVRKGLDRLNPMDRETLMAFYFRGQSLDQMSREHEAPVGTIKRRLHVARNRLRRELECAAV